MPFGRKTRNQSCCPILSASPAEVADEALGPTRRNLEHNRQPNVWSVLGHKRAQLRGGFRAFRAGPTELRKEDSSGNFALVGLAGNDNLVVVDNLGVASRCTVFQNNPADLQRKDKNMMTPTRAIGVMTATCLLFGAVGYAEDYQVRLERPFKAGDMLGLVVKAGKTET